MNVLKNEQKNMKKTYWFFCMFIFSFFTNLQSSENAKQVIYQKWIHYVEQYKLGTPKKIFKEWKVFIKHEFNIDFEDIKDHPILKKIERVIQYNSYNMCDEGFYNCWRESFYSRQMTSVDLLVACLYITISYSTTNPPTNFNVITQKSRIRLSIIIGVFYLWLFYRFRDKRQLLRGAFYIVHLLYNGFSGGMIVFSYMTWWAINVFAYFRLWQTTNVFSIPDKVFLPENWPKESAFAVYITSFLLEPNNNVEIFVDKEWVINNPVDTLNDNKSFFVTPEVFRQLQDHKITPPSWIQLLVHWAVVVTIFYGGYIVSEKMIKRADKKNNDYYTWEEFEILTKIFARNKHEYSNE